MQKQCAFMVAICVFCVLAFMPLNASAQTQAVGEYARPGQDCADQWVLAGAGAGEPLPAVSELTHGFSGGALERPLCLVAVVAPGGVYLDQTFFAVAGAPAGSILHDLHRPFVSGHIPIAECWPATLGFDDLNDDGIPDIVMMLECQDRNLQVYARPNTVYLSRSQDGGARWEQDARINEEISLFTSYNELVMGARALLVVEPATSSQQDRGVQPGQTVALRAMVRSCDAGDGVVVCTVVFADGSIRRISMRADPGLVRGRLGTPEPQDLAGREVVVEGEVDARGELVRVQSMRLVE
ncbi:hypothetical protein [Oceanidesulfovibrio indonesiensis]|nr:hypothetical protein [Oceanidesulfovibrio indonesiensis]